MPPFTVQDIVRATRGALVAGDLGVPITGVSIDSRSLGVGEAFFAIRGYRLDGHAFLADYRPSYREQPAFELWSDAVAFLDKHLKG